jgi:hypothetical protein
MEKDAENRYQSAKELLVDLRRLSSQSTPLLAAEPQKRTGMFEFTCPVRLLYWIRASRNILVVKL